MKDYTIAETFTLPSKGKVYDNILVAPTFKMASMTTTHEMRRLAPSELPYKNMCDIIDECMIDNPGISAYDMCVGDYQFCLHKLRIVTYGPQFKMNSVCPYCGFENQEVINLEDFEVLEYNEDIEKYREFVLPSSGKKIKLNVETPRRLDNITERVKEFKRKNPDSLTDQSLVFTLSGLIKSVDGIELNQIKLEEWIRNLPMKDTNVILHNADKFNTAIGINTEMEETCNMCLLTYRTNFRATSEFFRPTLDI